MLAARHPYEDALMSKSKKRDGALNSKRRAARDPRDHSRHSQPPAIDWESLNHKPAFSVAEFCARVGISRQTFHNWQTHGIGPHTIKCGGRVLITRRQRRPRTHERQTCRTAHWRQDPRRDLW
jgi:hypothetical protein